MPGNMNQWESYEPVAYLVARIGRYFNPSRISKSENA